MIRPCSQPEREALGSVAAELQARGYAVDVEEVAARPSNEPWLAAYAGLTVVAALALYVAPLATAVLGAVALVLHARDAEGRPMLRRASCTAVNVVARAPLAERPALVVVAPSSAAPRRFAERTQRALTVALQAAMTLVAAGGAAAWVAEAETELPVVVAGASAAAAAVVAVLAIVLYGSAAPVQERPRTLDLLLQLAPDLREHPVWLVATGGRRGGMAGIQGVLADHAEAGGAAWLNLEPAAGGTVVAVSEEGTWRERRADRFLLGAAEEAGAEVRPYRAAPTDATVLLARRRRALTLLVPRDGLQHAHAVVLSVTREVARNAGGRP
ncbi:MAG TPA: hypothetical protein VG318_09600 [Actinomycetota bacterium]|nr:hypothetical protein [Actinomycetota bacterium]